MLYEHYTADSPGPAVRAGHPVPTGPAQAAWEHAGTGNRAQGAEDKDRSHGEAVHARTGKRALQRAQTGSEARAEAQAMARAVAQGIPRAMAGSAMAVPYALTTLIAVLSLPPAPSILADAKHITRKYSSPCPSPPSIYASLLRPSNSQVGTRCFCLLTLPSFLAQAKQLTRKFSSPSWEVPGERTDPLRFLRGFDPSGQMQPC